MPERLKAILDKITAWWKKFNTKLLKQKLVSWKVWERVLLLLHLQLLECTLRK